MAHLALRVFLKLHCGHRVQGKVRLDRPSLLVANHASHADIAALFAALPLSEVTRVRTAAARDTIYALPAPLVAAIEFMFGTYPFERKAGSHESLEEGARYLSQGYHLAIFPEGRRSDQGLLPFTPGFAKMAYATGAPVIPVRIDGAGRVLPRGKKRVQRLPLEVHFHPPIHADRSVPYELRRQAYARLMEQAQEAVQS
jgi:1-acyl-sn-glycerol-3-phosphate acyltransferase